MGENLARRKYDGAQVDYRPFSTTYRSHLQGSRSPRGPFTLEDGTDAGYQLQTYAA